MPLTLPGVTGAVLAGISATGNVGYLAPQLAAGIANGVLQYTPQIVVMTVDTGSAGSGSGGPIPVIIPGSIYGAMTNGFASFGIIGMLAPLLATGFSNGLIQAYSQGVIKTTHAGVGVGGGVATFKGPAAGPIFVAGFKSAGLIGLDTDRLALAVGQALDTVFVSLVIPIPIVGSPSPTGASGVGIGQIL